MEEDTKFVVDASVLLSYLMPDEDSSELIQRLVKKHSLLEVQLIAPDLLPYEVANTLKSGMIKKRISLKDAKKLLGIFIDLKIDLYPIDHMKALELADKYKVSAYDASYLVLAKSNEVKILSLDKRLVEVAK